MHDLVRHRLLAQHLTSEPFASPGEVVQWFGAVQAQDYLAALWAIGLRLPDDATEATVEQAIADKSIVRFWFMRGTIHFLPAADLRWMLKLLEPRLRRMSQIAPPMRNLGLDEETLARSQPVLAAALQGGKQLTRPELGAALEAAGIGTQGMRLMSILHRAQVEGLICHGPRRGKQFTFTLLDEWLPPTPPLARDAALAEFTRRYFTSHGPATVQDFVWWSGLTTAETRQGLAALGPALSHEEIGGQTYWFAPNLPAPRDISPEAYLLPNYDEMIVAYKDRSALFDERQPPLIDPRADSVFNPNILIDGCIVGMWKRTLQKAGVLIETREFAPFTPAESAAFAAAAARYARFLGLPLVL